MVMTFRVSELQVLLGFAGRNKSGRKQDLMHRAIELVKKGCTTPVQIKIRELYRRRYPGKVASSHQGPSAAHGAAPGMPPFSPKGTGHSAEYGRPPDPSSHGTHIGHQNVPVHPDVRFKSLAFFDRLAELLKPSSLVPRSPSRFQETSFVFHLTPQQAQDVAMSRDLRPSARNEYSVQVQLRFCLLETSCDQEDNFPPSICVRVNGKMAPLPNPIPTNKQGVEPKRPSRPVNITSICRISPTVSNHINISWASEFGRGYCVAVYLVRKLSSEILMQRLKQNSQRHPDHTRALIKEKLAHDPDSEIATTSLRVSLLCPLGKMRMTMPCRATSCNHLQCFDAPTYLQMNEKKPTWVCPVCDKPAGFNKLVIDGLFVEINKMNPDFTEIEFFEDGSWQPKKAKEASDNNVTLVHSICADDSPKKSTKKEEAEVSVIDLTETDDEEDDDDNDDDVHNVSMSSSGESSDSTIVADDSPKSPDSFCGSSSLPSVKSQASASASSSAATASTSSNSGSEKQARRVLQNQASHEKISCLPSNNSSGGSNNSVFSNLPSLPGNAALRTLTPVMNCPPVCPDLGNRFSAIDITLS